MGLDERTNAARLANFGLTRRSFLDLGARGLAAASLAPLWLDGAVAQALGRSERPPFLAVIFLRGAADGLHLVPPTGDRNYARARASLALEKSLPFATGFGLHPRLEALQPLVEAGHLAAIHACGSPRVNRSHFEAQDLVEAGEGDSPRLHSGWLARGLRRERESNPFASVALTSMRPLSLAGSGSFALADAGDFGLPGASDEARRRLALDYGSEPDRDLSRSGTLALEALAEFESKVARNFREHSFGERNFGERRGGPRHRRRGRRGGELTHRVSELLSLEAAGLPIDTAFLESDGWDTHQNQGTEKGQMANHIADLGTAIADLAAGLEGRREWQVFVHTEFGRTVAPNGSRGSDHGHGSVALVAGSRVRGGVYGDWPGLRERDLSEGRDLKVTSDYRSVAWEVLKGHLGATPPPDTFPGFRPQALGFGV